jgi:hypothetical protein
MTEWKECPRWPDYEVGDSGQIRRIRGGLKRRLLQPRALPVGGHGYVVITFWQDGRHRSETLHTLICEAFHGPRPSPKHYACHWDGDKLNNLPTNLRWALPVENSADARRHGTLPMGEKNGRAILTTEQVECIREEYKAYQTYRGDRRKPAHVLAAKYGVTWGCIKAIVQNANWTHVSGTSVR